MLCFQFRLYRCKYQPSISVSLSNANYNWSINCTDKAGNTNASNETRTLTVSYTAPVISGGGSSSTGEGGAELPQQARESVFQRYGMSFLLELL